MIGKTRAIVVSPSTYPLSAFWLAATVMLPMTVSGMVPLNVGVGLLTVTAMAQIVVAFKRDLDSVHTQQAELVERAQQLTEALVRESIPIPPIRTRKVP